MKLVLIGLGIFFLAFPAMAGTFLDTFDDGKLVDWQDARSCSILMIPVLGKLLMVNFRQ